MFKSLIVAVLESQVKRFFRKHQTTLVAVVGSVGKTSTKLFTASLLREKYRVLCYEGNHNTELSAPLAILGLDMPLSLKNPLAWVAVFLRSEMVVWRPPAYDVIVVELGADHPGDIE